MATIRTTNGFTVTVDDDLCAWLMEETWFAAEVGRKHLAKGTKSGKFMHRVILNAPPGTIVDHENGDGLDNRKKNLKYRTSATGNGVAMRGRS